MIAPEAPWPATTGGMVRIAALLDQMARHFDVTFVTPLRPGQRTPPDARIRFACPAIADGGRIRRARALLQPLRPYHVAFYSHPEVERVVRRELAATHYDVVFGHFIYSLQYLAGARIPTVIDQQNVDRLYWRNKAEESRFPVSAFARWNMAKTVAFETRHLPGVWAYVSVSEEDRDRTREYAQPPVGNLWVARNGVDTRRFRPPDTRAAGPLTLGYLGSMGLQMNVEAVERFTTALLPRIRQAVPGLDLRFLVIGSHPSPGIRDLAAATPGMSLSGTVDDVVPWLQRLDIMVSPLRIGAGTKLKVAEAMACGLPVVGTSLAFAGLPGRSGEHFLQADDDESFVAGVRLLAESAAARDRMGRQARELAGAELEWDSIGDRLADDITRALET